MTRRRPAVEPPGGAGFGRGRFPSDLDSMTQDPFITPASSAPVVAGHRDCGMPAVRLVVLAAVLALASLGVAAPASRDVLSRSFEVRHISSDLAANGESDFLGPTTVLSTEQRVEFLRVLAAAARRNFANPGWNQAAVDSRDVSAALSRLKPRPTPDVRRRLPIERWRWLGYREGAEAADRAKLGHWQARPDLVARGDGALGFRTQAEADFRFSSQDWRFLVRLQVRRASDSLAPVAIRIGDGLTLAIDGQGRLRSGEDVVGTLPLATWTELRIEVALDAEARCYNLTMDGQPVIRAGALGSAVEVDRVTVVGSEGWEIRDVWVQSYTRTTAHPQVPIAMTTVCDETFRVRPTPSGFAEPTYDDGRWLEALAPFAHGGERRAGEVLYLRHRFEAPERGRVWFQCETLFPGGEVWINGRVIHVQHDPRPVRLDLSRFVVRGGSNLLAVRVDPFVVQRHIAHGPADRHSGWFAGRAWLDITDDDYIEDVFATTLRLEPNPTLRVRVRLNTAVWAPVDSKSKPDAGRTRAVRIQVRPWFPEDGAIAAETVGAATLAYFGRSVELECDVSIPGGQLWSPDRPFLYRIDVRLETPDGQTLDDLPTVTGLRTVDQSGGVFRLNGRPDLLRGGLLFGMRPPLEDQALNLRCAPLPHLVREVLLAKAAGGNCIRLTIHEGTYLGSNDPRLAEIGDQLGLCFLWSTSAWVRTASPWQIDLGLLAEDAKLVRNHPSIVMWQPGNHPIFFSADDGMAWWREVFHTLLAVDDSRLISPVGSSGMIQAPSDDGRRARDGRKDLVPEPTWIHPLAGRGDFDCPTGYRKPPGVWSYLRLWPETPDWSDGEFVWTRSAFKREYLESKTHAWFDFESEETIGQPNWDLLRGSAVWRIMSYEHGYDEMSIGRRLDFHEWEISQAWQALSVIEAYRKKRLLDYDGLFWCPLDGGGNTGTYQKPVTDHLGNAKMAFYALRMVFQPTLAGSGDVDISYGPADAVRVRIAHLGADRVVDLHVRATTPAGETLAETRYPRVHLAAGRTVADLPDWKPMLPSGSFVVFEYWLQTSVSP
jgi:hypothetical protein